MLRYRDTGLPRFSDVLTISICCSFRHALSPSTSRIKDIPATGSGDRIIHNYQIYFDQLLCFQEISMTESHGQNSALNFTVKLFHIA